MTVRINKDAINLREKLSQLDKPSGLVGEELLRADTSADAREALNLEEHLFEDFESTGIDDNATSTVVTVSDSGLDVTGTVTADGGVSLTTSGVERFAINKNFSPIIEYRLSTNNYHLSLESVGASQGDIKLYTGTTSAVQRANFASNGDVSFYEDTGTTAKFVWDASAERLGIGTASPDGDLDVRGAGLADLVVRATSANSTARILMQNDAQSFALRINGDDKFRIKDETSDVDRLVIDTSGNVGIGTSSPNKPLTVKGEIRTEYLLDGAQSYWGTASNKVYFGTSEAYPLTFSNNGTERARIDSSGNLLVGTTNTAPATNNVSGISLSNEGHINVSRNDGIVGYFNRQASDGNILSFHKDGSKVGSVNTNTGSISLNSSGSNMVLSASGVGFQFDSTTIRPFSGNDASVDLGRATSRFKDLYLSGGVITSSDYRLKEDVQPMQSYADTVKQMNLVNFAWKDSGKREDGFIAHELQSLVPSAVRGDKDAIDEDGNEQYQGVDPLKLIPVLTKALQEALERIETLENK